MSRSACLLCGLVVARLSVAQTIGIVPQVDDRVASQLERIDLTALSPEAAAALGAKLATRLYGPQSAFRNRLTFTVDAARPGLLAVLITRASIGGARLQTTVGDQAYARSWPPADKTHQVDTTFSVPVPAGRQEVVVEATTGVLVVGRFLWLPDGQAPDGVALVALEPAAAAPEVPVALTDDTCLPWDGYRGIWFSIGQDVPTYGAKYSGGLGTYTAKHRPTAIYAAAVERTFFTYGGIDDGSGDLQIMVSYFDHRTGTVPRPTRLLHWQHWSDPHCNASLAIAPDGRIWVFISGRARARAGYKYRSRRPHDVTDFEQMRVEEMAYPQPWYLAGQGFLHLFTKYTAGRELYWETSDPSGTTWSDDHKLAGFGGHYQVSAEQAGRVVTAFNYHPGGADTRTNLYFAQTTDDGRTWTTADGRPLTLPLDHRDNPALVCDWEAQGLLCYLKDITFDPQGRPLVLFLTSHNYHAGPPGDPRLLRLARWTGTAWVVTEVCRTDHNYDMGSLYLEPDLWRILAPTEPGAQPYHTGGEVASWVSRDQGATWSKERDVTQGSALQQSYVRRPLDAHDPFYAFWAEADAHDRGPSALLFCNHDGTQVWRLPTHMAGDEATPEPLATRR